MCTLSVLVLVHAALHSHEIYTRVPGGARTAVTAVAVLKMKGCGEGRGCDAVTGGGAGLRCVESRGCAYRPQLHDHAQCSIMLNQLQTSGDL